MTAYRSSAVVVERTHRHNKNIGKTRSSRPISDYPFSSLFGYRCVVCYAKHVVGVVCM